MAQSMKGSILFLFLTFCCLRLVSSSFCCLQSHIFLNNLQSQCPISLAPTLSIEVDGESLDRALKSCQRNVYTAVLFHASWCQYSRRMRPTFDVLSSMFPQIRHLAVDQSAAMPSVFSRYSIHSLPSLLLVNHTAKVRYQGLKDLDSLVRFYKKITGFEPIDYLTDIQKPEITEKPLLQLLDGSSRKVTIAREPFLAFSILFLSFKAFLYFLPGLLSRLKAFWALYIPHLNLEIFGETSQLIGRVLQMVDVKRMWTKVTLCKTRNFQKGAKNARVWASSLASVSLGKSSSVRPSRSGES